MVSNGDKMQGVSWYLGVTKEFAQNKRWRAYDNIHKTVEATALNPNTCIS